MIRVSDVNKRYPGASEPTLRGVSFDVPPGGLAAILGRSGAGKSTLLRCLVGLESFNRGSVAVDGAQMIGTEQTSGAGQRRAAVAALRANMGLVFQSFELFPHLTVMENCVLAPTKVKGEARSSAEARARSLLEQLGLADKSRAYPDHLSGGQRQRVAIARALAMRPRALLYDEPTSALDPSLKQEVLQTIKRIQGTGVTQIMVTHDVHLARAANVVFILAAGKVVEQGNPEQVLSHPQAEETRRLLAAEGS